jgi:hypothetical protein
VRAREATAEPTLAGIQPSRPGVVNWLPRGRWGPTSAIGERRHRRETLTGATIEIRRITTGPSLVIEDAPQLALDFFRTDASSAPGGYDDLAGGGERDRITRGDIVAINTTMRARSPHAVWDVFLTAKGPQPWLVALDPAWDLVALDDATWQNRARAAVEGGIVATVGRGRGLSVATKVLHFKRPGMFPVLDSLVLQQLGVTDSVPAMHVIDHLRSEGRRNLDALLGVQAVVGRHYRRSLVRILDALLWTSHPAAGLAPALRGWQHVVRPAPVVGRPPPSRR